MADIPGTQEVGVITVISLKMALDLGNKKLHQHYQSLCLPIGIWVSSL